MTKTKIEWAEQTWNPTVGCTRVSAGCDNCYAFRLHDERYARNLDQRRAAEPDGDIRGHMFPRQYDLPFSVVQLFEDRLEIPARRKKPTRYFVDSMADLFHEDVPDAYLDQVFRTMAGLPRHQFLILTKRPERMERFVHDQYNFESWTSQHAAQNIWLGVSVEDQAAADKRIPYLKRTGAAIRFLSVEPLIASVKLDLRGIDWVIVGGESGPRARPCYVNWIRDVALQCAIAEVPLFVKQLGSKPVLTIDGANIALPVRDRKGGDMEAWPSDLRIREYPVVKAP